VVPLQAHYNIGLVFLSVLISVGASYAALSLSERVRAAVTQGCRHMWTIAGAISMGIGVWAMHYLGMLALDMPVPVYYHLPTLLLSLFLAIAAAKVAFAVVSQENTNPRRIIIGGSLMGCGIGGMHYVGMAAMRSKAMEHYNPWIAALSVVIAVGFSCLALWIAFASRKTSTQGIKVRLAASIAMGLAISSMHYVAMAGVHFTYDAMPFSLSDTVEVGELGTSVIAVMTILTLLVALGSSVFDKWRFNQLSKVNADLISAQSALLQVQQQLTEANAQLSELSVTDGLTGLFNRRHFDAALETEVRRAFRNKTPISLLMIDLDLFKALNDGYGHQRGDDCLREVAQALNSLPRRGYDVMARYGGEEFVLLLPDASYEATIAIAESIRLAVLALNIENLSSTFTKVVTVSIGVCCQGTRFGYDAGDLVHRADKALYEAKRLGRNRVCVAAALVS
jgi:diguanylate cyclase (GGDEF)-like protein